MKDHAPTRVRNGLSLAFVALLAACATSSGPTPARLTNPDAQTLARVKAVLARALSRNVVELGAVDFATSSTIPVLPPPLAPFDGRSLATPVLFDIVKDGSACRLVSRSDGKAFALDGVACTSVGD
jgi:hypothetical protein